jgi:peroxiredoxin
MRVLGCRLMIGRKGDIMALPKIGSTALGFTLPNQDGRQISLADYVGNNVLVWFYPRAFGGG